MYDSIVHMLVFLWCSHSIVHVYIRSWFCYDFSYMIPLPARILKLILSYLCAYNVLYIIWILTIRPQFCNSNWLSIPIWFIQILISGILTCIYPIDFLLPTNILVLLIVIGYADKVVTVNVYIQFWLSIHVWMPILMAGICICLDNFDCPCI